MSREVRSFRAMGVEVLVGGASETDAEAAGALFAEWDRIFSRFRPASELSRVNRSPAELVTVSPLFAGAVRTALAAAAATGGLVDPTLGVAIESAGYDRDFAELAGDPRPAGPAAPGRWRKLGLVGRILERPPGTKLDLNGVVKALAVDNALTLLAGDGWVAAGGDVAIRGGAAVGLPDRATVFVHAGGVATSGSTRRHWIRDGEGQHHLLDPCTGRPARSRWREVTVVARTCLAADVAAKAAFLLSEDGPGWLDERALAGRFLGDGELVENRAWREATAEAVAC